MGIGRSDGAPTHDGGVPTARDKARSPSDEDASALVADVNKVIDDRRVTTLFQPVVHLATAEVVGYEALTRGPAGSRVESPLQLLEAGRLAGRLVELDWMCAAAACAAAVAADLHPSMTIFLNFEPETLLAPCPPHLLGPARQALDHLRVMIETKEDSLHDAPSRLLEALALVHDVGWGVAIDNAEASPATLALLPLVQPDVLKLDLRRLRGKLSTVARMTDGARTYAERTGAMILAQGVEDNEDLHIGAFAGATYGQGLLFGSPGPLPTARVTPRSVFPLLPKLSFSSHETPFEVVTSSCPLAITEKRFLVQLSHYLENEVDAHGPAALLLVNYQAHTHVDATARDRLAQLTRRSAFTVAFGSGLAAAVGTDSRIRSGEVGPGDPIGDEWIVVVLGPHYAVALVARDLGDRVARPYRRFEYAVTHDRDLVLRAALTFLSRVNIAASPLVG